MKSLHWGVSKTIIIIFQHTYKNSWSSFETYFRSSLGLYRLSSEVINLVLNGLWLFDNNIFLLLLLLHKGDIGTICTSQIYWHNLYITNILAQFVHHLLHENPAGEGDGVANRGDDQTIILHHVLEPATVVMMKNSRRRKVWYIESLGCWCLWSPLEFFSIPLKTFLKRCGNSLTKITCELYSIFGFFIRCLAYFIECSQTVE